MIKELILKFINKKNCNYKKLKNVELYNEIQKDVWDHHLFKGLEEKEIEKINNTIPIPNIYSDFLKEINGCNLLEEEILFYGMEKFEKGLSQMEKSYQPKDIVWENRQSDYNFDIEKYFIIGEIYEEIIFVIDKQSNAVLSINVDTGKTIKTYNDLYALIKHQLSKYF